ncbi:unnamed protein product [Didymodactylos carnosus]|uniref:Uncharacterized protein n=1 Tax=Didymodactylos carnosus TaxID=1234261 RepID=A0A815PIG6_9BILA|nr:unnamed protein product [Didymodactylos carnosus]CAF1449449.1 unnamed protein product [Didymodactylos carnosus]CAF4200208.1 unnamed protein product [Didymodactylos carnosus]CAF4323195.1 unnamed protein product [Didymodactylos carnosus]
MGASNQSHATIVGEDGLDGLPGEDEKIGGNGGNIYFIDNKHFKGQENIEKLITSGGDGGKGRNGGNGDNGHDGKDGDNASGKHGLGFFVIGYDLKRGKPGIRGGDGGNGGDAGLDGFGGHAAKVHIEENGKIVHDNNELVNKIESTDKSNISAEHGKPSEGGKGGKG